MPTMKTPAEDARSLAPSQPVPAHALRPLPVVDSATLLQGRSEVQITHGDCIYTLRQTRQGKLILTK